MGKNFIYFYLNEILILWENRQPGSAIFLASFPIIFSELSRQTCHKQRSDGEGLKFSSKAAPLQQCSKRGFFIALFYCKNTINIHTFFSMLQNVMWVTKVRRCTRAEITAINTSPLSSILTSLTANSGCAGLMKQPARMQ